MIKLIIFDHGGVLTSTDVEKIDSMMARYVKIRKVDYLHYLARYKSRITRGFLTLKEFYTKLSKRFRLDKSGKDIFLNHIKIYKEILDRLNKKNLTIVKKLKMHYTLVALVNTEPDVLPYNYKAGLYKQFDRSYISCQLGLEKPDRRIYLKVIKDYKCRPKEVLFIDDKIENIEAAKKIELGTIQFTKKTRLAKELAKFGIKLN